MSDVERSKSESLSDKDEQEEVDIQEFIKQLNNIETNNLIQYHNYLRSKLVTHYQEDVTTEDEKQILDNFDSLLNVNTFLMVYSFLEGDLYQIAKFNQVKLDEGNDSLLKYKTLIDSFENKLLSGTNSWQIIEKAIKIRNTLLHCNGIIETSRDKACINQLIKSSKSNIKSINGKLVLTSKYLSDFVSAVKQIKTKVFRINKN